MVSIMNKKIIIPLLVLAVIIPAVSILGFDTVPHDDRVYTHSSAGISSGASIEELADNADYIVEGKLTNAKSITVPMGSSDDPLRIKALTYWTIQVDKTYKGEPTKELVFLKAGGETDKVVSTYEGLQWKLGDTIFVYLTEEDGILKQYGTTNVSFKLTESGIAEAYPPWNSKPIEQLRQEQTVLTEKFQ